MDVTTLALAKQYTNKKLNNIVFDGYKSFTVRDNDYSLPAPFTELVGLIVTDKVPNRRILTTPQRRYSGANGVIMETDIYGVEYSNYGGFFDKPCLMIGGPGLLLHCPTFFYAGEYDGLFYVYEETHDAMGYGVTLQKGWYAVSQSTVTIVPVDIAQHPFITRDDIVKYGSVEALDYLREIFPIVDTLTYTVTTDNILTTVDGIRYVAPVKISHITACNEFAGLGLITEFASFGYENGTVSVYTNTNRETTIQYHTVEPLDSKFIPSTTPTIQKAEVGQSPVVKTVDENGKPTEWEGKDIFNEAVSISKEYTDTKVDTIVYDGYNSVYVPWQESVDAPFTDLIGLNVADRARGRRLLGIPKQRPTSNRRVLFQYSGDENGEGGITFDVEYHGAGVMFDKDCLMINPMPDSDGLAVHCPSFFAVSEYDTLVYCYEETSDALGMGITMPPGWYAVNSTSLNLVPFDLEQHPFFTSETQILLGEKSGAEEDLREIFPLTEEIFYTVGADNIYADFIVAPAKLSDIPEFTGDAYKMFYLFATCSFYTNGNTLFIPGDNLGYEDRSAIVQYPVIKQLDPKFIPDNTPNIKKAEVGDTVIVKAVDENGVPTAWESATTHEKTLTAAKEYTDSQRLAHTETKTIKWDRNIDGMEVVMLEENAENNVYYRAVKVSDEPVELTKDSVRHLEIFAVQFEGKEYECSESLSVNLDEAIFASGEGMNYLILDQFGGNPAVIAVPQDITDTDDEGNEIVFIAKGLWFADLYVNSTTYCITSMTVDEIHRIESKYLPIGGWLPVFTLTTAPDLSGDEVVLTEEECRQLDTAAATNGPCIINCAADGNSQTTIGNFANVNGDYYIYWTALMPEPDSVGNVYQTYLVFMKENTEDYWVMSMNTMPHRVS